MWIIYRILGPILRWWKRRRCRGCVPWWDDCPWCGYDGFDLNEDPWFECTSAGTDHTHDGLTHWWHGIQTCPRCRHKWESGDSS